VGNHHRQSAFVDLLLVNGCPTMMWMSLHTGFLLLLLLQRRTSIFALNVEGVPVFKVPQSKSSGLYALAVSDPMHPIVTNFLATQVWPSARLAAQAIDKHLDPSWSLCEFGCGPGMPSLAAAAKGARVLSTDLDLLALKLVQQAAKEQGYPIETQPFDLLSSQLSDLSFQANVYLFSDVFESAHVARGAARITHDALRLSNTKVWVCAQSDRAQRQVYLEEMKRLLNDNLLDWTPLEQGPPTDSDLWLCNVDETSVSYS
jgi:hypothetical protein